MTDANGATVTATFSLAVSAPAPVVPTLTFAPIASQMYGNAPFTVSATSASSGAVTYAVVSGPATIAGNLVTLTGVGTVALSANQAASGNYTAATANTSFAVTTGFTITAGNGAGSGTSTGSGSSSGSSVPSATTTPGGAVTFGLTMAPQGTIYSRRGDLQRNRAAHGGYGYLLSGDDSGEQSGDLAHHDDSDQQ